MKILQVCPRYYPSIGGVEEHVQNVSERFARNHLVTIATTDPSGQLPKEEVIAGVRILRFRSWAPNEAYYFSEGLRKYLMKNSGNFEVVHAHSYHAFPALCAAYAKKSNRFVFTPHYFSKGATAFRTLLHIPYKVLARKIFQKTDAVICASNYEKTLLMGDFQIRPDMVSVIPNGVALSDFKGVKRRRQSHFRSVLYVGRLEKFKGVHYLIEALPNLDEDIILSVIGSGTYYKNLVRLADQLRVKDRVFFYGGSLPRAEIIRKYFEADLFVLLSKYENYSISVAEALASGTPCIVANTSALTEWVDNKNCYGINYPIDINELVTLTNRIIGTTVEGTKLFDWDDVTPRIMKTYLGDKLRNC